MRRLPLTDAGWLLAEDRDRPMHVGGLLLLRPPEDAGDDFVREQLVGAGRDDLAVRPPFDQRLARPYGRAGAFHWVPDDAIDLDVHVRHLALPAPGRIRELLELVSANHSTLLDRHRPLWQLTVVEGLEDGRVALHAKIHHAVLDGIAAMRQLTAACTTDPDERDLPPPWALERSSGARADRARDPLAVLTGMATAVPREVTAALGVGRTLSLQALRSLWDEAESLPFRAPRTILDQPLTGTRRYVAQSYALDRLRAVADGFDATLNDVVLTLCAGALRRYLLDLDALPAEPLVAAVPVDIRPADAEASGNALSLLLTELATDVADHTERLHRIKAAMDRGKRRLRAMSRREVRDYGLALMAPVLLAQLTGAAGWVRPVHNLTISNVPGPAQPLYLNGARVEGCYPISLLPDGDTLNITQLSYAGSLELGITADRDRLPRVQRLIDHVEETLAALEEAAG